MDIANRQGLALLSWVLALAGFFVVLHGCGGGGKASLTPQPPAKFSYPTNFDWTGTGDVQQPPGKSNLFGWLVTDQDDPPYPEHASHLGIDIQSSSNSPVYALTSGVVAANATDTTNYIDRALWIRHKLPDGGSFYAVYGHVDSSLRAGTPVEAGRQIATITEQNNPHLHLGIHPGGITYPWGRGTIPENWTIQADPDKKQLPKGGWVPPRTYLESHFDSRSTSGRKR